MKKIYKSATIFYPNRTEEFINGTIKLGRAIKDIHIDRMNNLIIDFESGKGCMIISNTPFVLESTLIDEKS